MPERDGSPFDEEFLRKIELLRLAVRRLGTTGREGEQPSRRTGASMEVVRRREYVPGDEIRHIDWAAYARLEQLLIRQFAREEAVALELVLDASESMRGPKLDRARQLAAALGYMALHSRGRTSVHWPVRAGLQGRAFSGSTSASELIQYLSEEPPRTVDFDLARAMEEVSHRASPRPFLVILSDFWMEDPLPILRRAHARFGQVAMIHLLSPEEVDPDLKGKIRLIDSETEQGKELYLDEDTLKDYRADLQAHLRKVENACRESEVGYVFIRSDLPLEKAFFRTVQEAGIRG